MKNETGLLLDTHTLIWFVEGREKLKSAGLQAIESAIKERTLYLCAISFWEIAMLAKKQRIILSEPVLPWLKKVIKILGLRVVELSPEVAIESIDLPGESHGDPADRMIIAAARLYELKLATRDTKILEYARAKYLQVVEI
ncbi:MAG TPA: type II toxin-antitoxin system VapC family toxin [Gammaproteobacteria bacterium]|nr:type II toxin-antitoxin system VapC family toxin [Gammaproteobacteria bacterium]